MIRAGLALLLAFVGVAVWSPGVQAGQPWHDGYFPNVVLTDQDGRKHAFYDDLIKGKVVALNFIYTKCKDVCPADTAQMLQVQDLLGERIGRDVYFYSISLDPENDTPRVLKRYRHMFGINSTWLFLTGKKSDIVLIQRKLGLIGERVPSLKEHNTSLIVGNETTAQWIKRSPYDHPKVLANLLSDGLRNYADAGAAAMQSFAAAKQISGQTRGDYLFRTRCTACHTVGGGDKLGPDLKGVVAARSRGWLTRWLKEPDKMIAEKDPVAVALKARYRNLPMPNLGLNDVDAEALITYLATADTVAAQTSRQASSNPLRAQ
jgi:protein SCO1/2